MSIFHRVLDRIANWRWTGRKINLRFIAEYRTTCFALPIIKAVLAEDEDGETYRAALTDWRRSERPPLALYRRWSMTPVASSLRIITGPNAAAGY